ncbi:hypothetical protein ACLOJK_021846, partial [Asimina triloba]
MSATQHVIPSDVLIRVMTCFQESHELPPHKVHDNLSHYRGSYYEADDYKTHKVK